MGPGERHGGVDTARQRVTGEARVGGDDERRARRQVDRAREVESRPVALVARHGDPEQHGGRLRLAPGPVDARRGAGVHQRARHVAQGERCHRVLLTRRNGFLCAGQA